MENKNLYEDVAGLMGFLSERNTDDGDRYSLYRNIVTTAVRAAFEGLKYETDETYIKDYRRGKNSKAELGETIDLLSAEEYQKYLESLNNEKREIVQYMAKKLAAYDQYKDGIRLFLEEMRGFGKINEHPAHIAQDVFNIVIGGKECVLKYRPYPGHIAAYLMGTSYIEGEDHFEQILAVSVEDGVILSEKIPGEQMNKLSPEDVMNVSDQQIKQCFESLFKAHEKDLPMENKSKNIMYDKDAGFGFIDFISDFGFISDGKNHDLDLLPYYFNPVFNGLVNIAGKADWKPKTRETIEKNLSAYKNSLLMANRIKPIILEILANRQEKEEMEKTIQDYIDYISNKIRDYSDEEFVAKILEENN